jgi:glucose-1-phosphate adenylyltransferase
MENCMGIICFTNVDHQFGDLCKERPAALLPFGGKYRLIDFFLSNMVECGIGSIGIFTGTKIRSLMNHIKDSRPWDLDLPFKGFQIFPPLYDDEKEYHRGNLTLLSQTAPFFTKSPEENIFICSTDQLLKIDMEQAYAQFLNTNADITLIKKEENEKEIFTGSFFVKKSIFLELVKKALEEKRVDDFHEAIEIYQEDYQCNNFYYTGCMYPIQNTKQYFEANMALLKPGVYEELFYYLGSIYTTDKNEAPTMYQKDAKVSQSIIANGCKINGEVIHSIIFRGVEIKKGAKINHAIVMQKATIEENAKMVYTIVDKWARVTEYTMLEGSEEEPYIVAKEMVIK